MKRLQFVVLLVTATYLSLVPKPGGVFEATSDKLLHLLCWSVLLVSLHLALNSGKFRWGAAAALFAYSVAVEFGQMWVPNRFFSPLDILANASGIAAGGLILWLYRRWFGPGLPGDGSRSSR